jgi:hypothetical protein
MMGNCVTNYEHEYRRTGRIITFLFALYLPVVGVLGWALGRLVDAAWPLFGFAGLWMAVLLVFSVLRFVAYVKWKYPKGFSGDE